jgi:hypothetical protein
MKKFDEFDDNEQKIYKKRSKRASNRPGAGIKIINSYVEEEDYYLDLEDDVESQDEVVYNKTS